jgi:subtilase family serine protease
VDLEAIVLGTSSNNLDVLIIGAVMAAIAGSVLMAVLFARRRRK